MNKISETVDAVNNLIRKGDRVAAETGEQGEIVALYDDGTVDIHHSDSHQGPVIDTFDIEGHNIVKIE